MGSAPAGLAVDADAELHLLGPDLEDRPVRRRRRARGQSDAEAAPLRVHLARDPGDLGERPAGLGLCPGDLLDENGDADAAATRGVEAVFDGDVVIRQDGLDLDSLVFRQLGRHAEVEDVAGVVLDDVDDTGAAVDGLRRGEHLVGNGEVNTAPGQAASSMPFPTKPPCNGS